MSVSTLGRRMYERMQKPNLENLCRRRIRLALLLVLASAPAGALAGCWSLELAGSFPYPTGATTHTFAVQGNDAFLLGDVEYFVVDVSDPAMPRLVGADYYPGGSALALSGDYAYVVSYDNRLEVVDITDR